MRVGLFAGCFAVLGAFLSGCICREMPIQDRLADCTNSTLQFKMAVRHDPPYQFLLGLSPASPGDLSFRGEIIVSQSTGTVARIPIDSQNVTPCNWLHGSSGYILTWERTNREDRLQSFLTKGRTYDVQVCFSKQPPVASSLWLSSMGKAGL
jgi:hypothetical protein